MKKANKKHLMIYRQTNTIPKKQKALLFFLALAFFILSISLFSETLGKFSLSFTASYTASVAKFDVIITPPEEFSVENDEYSFNHWFLSDFEVKGLTFKMYNNGETDVICTPHILGDVYYRVFIAGIEYTEFVIKTKESLDFQVVIGAEGLSALPKDTNLFIDLKQAKGGP